MIPGVPMADYVADRAEISGDSERPASLNSGLAHVLMTRSPFHAWYGHPRLNPAWAQDDDSKFDLGKAAHAALLEDKPLHVIRIRDEKTGEMIEPTDFKKKATKEARDAARTAGEFPVLAEHASDIASMVTIARTKIRACPAIGLSLSDFQAELTMLWRLEGAWLRCRTDWVAAATDLIVSYKTTRASAQPDAFMKTILGMGYDMQAAFEIAAVKAVTGTEPDYVWLVQEAREPFCCSLIGMTGQVRDFAATRFRRAVSLWSACLEDDRWPDYGDEIERPELPAYAEAQFIDRHGYQPDPDPDQPIEEAMFAKGIMP